MGITGLIPFLEKASKRCNVSEFAGGSVAIDSYCWLHKGAFSCADKIALGQPTDAYVKYCMKFVHMLLANRIKPILVFDGRHLPAKKETEVKRRESRESTRRRAAELMKMGQTSEGRNLLRRSVDITHEMALQLIKKCQEENVDCIVAPYEADAQLAYLNITGIADVIITEDSDLTLFGCKKIFFKMDINGNGLLVEQDRLHLAMNVRAEHFDIEKFRHMCILSGCDYLASLPGIGLSKACKFVLRNRDDDIHKALVRLGTHLNMKTLVVTPQYRDAFMCALVTFKHQLVYCPLQRKQVRLFPVPPEVTEEQLHYAGKEISEDMAYQLALGNYDPFTMKQLHNFNPDVMQTRRGKTNSWHEKTPTKHVSIWSRDYKVIEEKENDETRKINKWPNTSGQIKILNTGGMKRKTTTPKKRNYGELAEELSAEDALELYGSSKLQKNEEEASNGRCSPSSRPRLSPLRSDENEQKATSPVSPRKINPFARSTSNTEGSPSLVCRGKRRIKLKTFVGFRPTVINEDKVQDSKYFSPNSSNNDNEKKAENNDGKCVADMIVSPRKKVSENVIIENENGANFEATNIIEETPTDEETCSSSGIFLSEPAEPDINLEINRKMENRKSIIDVVDYQEREMAGNCDLLHSNKFLNKMANASSVSTEKNYDDDIDNDEEDYSIRKNNIESLRCSLFKWANTKASATIEKTSLNSAQPRRKPIVTAKTKIVRKIPSQKKPVTAESQQSLLNMFGFQKKTVFKHA